MPSYELLGLEEIIGVLGTDGEGCVTVTRDGETALLLAPRGTSLTSDGSDLVLPSGAREVSLGDVVTFDGEWTEVEPPLPLPRDWRDCVADYSAVFAVMAPPS